MLVYCPSRLVESYVEEEEGSFILFVVLGKLNKIKVFN